MSLPQSCCAPAGLARLDQILPLLRAAVTSIEGSEGVRLAAGRGRILAEPVQAARPVPPWDNAAMDGYALAAASLTASGETRLPLAGRAAAGKGLEGPLLPGHAVRIFTGAPLPEGADTVVMQEQCRSADGIVRLPAGLVPGSHVRRREDLAAGQVVLPAGRRLTPMDIGLAAAAGAATLVVKRRLRVAVFSTGDELCEPGRTPAPHGIFDANRFTLIGLLEELGCMVSDLGILPDRLEGIRDTLAAAAPAHDALVTSGGMSVGEEDHLKPALVAAGGRLDQWRLAIKPGKPVGVGSLGATLFLGLPGNPVAVATTFQLVARPLLLRLGGALEGHGEWPRLLARAGGSIVHQPGRRTYLAARLDHTAGLTVAHALAKQGSHVLSSLAAADALIELAEHAGPVAVGDPVTVLPLFRP